MAKAAAWPPRSRRRLRTTLPHACWTVLLASCQSYQPAPLDPDAHRAAWHARTIEESAVRPFLERLEHFERTRCEPNARFDATDGLDLAEGRLVALAFNPDLRLARLRGGRAAARAEHAGRWADPRFSLNVLRIAQSIPDPWLIAPSLSVSIPLSGRLAAERELAAARSAAADERTLEAEWTVWCDVEAAWLAWSAARLRVVELERFVETLDEITPRMDRLAEQGELATTEARLFALEASERIGDLQRERGDVAALGERLRSLLGLAPEAPVELEPLPLKAPARRPAALEPARLTEGNPSLRRLKREYDVSERALKREIRKQYPDLTLGPTFESESGQSRFGLSGGLPLPFFNRNRQGIATARAERELARAAYESHYERLIGQWSANHALAVHSAEQRSVLVEELMPLIDRQLVDALELLRLGEGSALVLLESLTRAHEAKLELVDVGEREALARLELTRLTGPENPTAVTAAPEDPR